MEVLQSHASIQPMVTMAINVRTDIFTDKALQANTENIQHKSEITVYNEGRKRVQNEKVEPNSKAMKMSAKEEKVKFSNNMKDAVKTVCQICYAEVSFVVMRSHTKSAHKLIITDYKLQHGELVENIVEEVYHRCGICSKKILFHGDAIATHAKTHRISHKEYNQKFISLLKDTEAPLTRKKEKKTSFENMSNEELLYSEKLMATKLLASNKLLEELDELIASL